MSDIAITPDAEKRNLEGENLAQSSNISRNRFIF